MEPEHTHGMSLSCFLDRYRMDLALVGRNLRRRHARQDHFDFRPLAGLAVEAEPAAQTIDHDVVDDMQPEPGAAKIAAGREERIEGLAPDAGTHAAAIVGEQHLDLAVAERPHLDVDDAI